MTPDIFLPTLHTFAMNNIFTGSCGLFLFRAKPNVVMATPKEVDFENSSMQAQIWYGPLCFEKSEIADCETFPLSEDGRQAMLTWLNKKV